MDKEEIKDLLARYNAGQATENERALLETWYNNHQAVPLDLSPGEIEEDIHEVYSRLPRPQRVIKLWPRIAAAAAILVFLSAGIYFFSQKTHYAQFAAHNYTSDIAPPNGSKAILTLSNGKKIILDNAQNGKLAEQGNTAISKSGGQVIYTASKSGIKNPRPEIEYNTISTLNGGKYKVILPDGTTALLNAASSLKFPTVFKGKERGVELTGEAYFEVAKNKAMPFHVKTAAQTVEVLGTHFDVMAYPEEKATETTLLEGSVKVTSNNSSILIKPGEQAKVTAGQKITVNQNMDIDAITAWTNNLFQFDNTGIDQTMRQVQRWYNVQIVYKGAKPAIGFTGVLPRNSKLSKLLHLLETTGGVKFDIQGNTITVSKK
jgi:transmembrane sensor